MVMHAHNIFNGTTIELESSDRTSSKISLARSDYIFDGQDSRYQYQFKLSISDMIDKISLTIHYILNNNIVRTEIKYINYDLYYIPMTEVRVFINMISVGVGEIFSCG